MTWAMENPSDSKPKSKNPLPAKKEKIFGFIELSNSASGCHIVKTFRSTRPQFRVSLEPSKWVARSKVLYVLAVVQRISSSFDQRYLHQEADTGCVWRRLPPIGGLGS